MYALSNGQDRLLQGPAFGGYRQRTGVSWPASPPLRQGLFHLLRALNQGTGDVPKGGTVRSAALARLEAVLLLAREPQGSRKLARLAGLADGTEARTLVRTLNRLYDVEGCAFRAVEVAGGFQLMSRAGFAPWLRRLHASQGEVRLSTPAMETLAVVAYRQPVLRVEIEAVRGVQCGEILRQLMERDLVRIVGRSEELGRPFLYGTTRLFLQVFGLRHLDELPRPDLCRRAQAAGRHQAADQAAEGNPERGQLNQPIYSIGTGGNANVKTAIDAMVAREDLAAASAATKIEEELEHVAGGADYDDDFEASDEDEDLDDEELDDDEDLDDEDEEEDDDEEEEDDDLEDDEWEEVEDDDELEDEIDEDDEDDDEDWDDEDDEDWDEEEEDEDWE